MKNTELLNSPINKTFEEILIMDDKDFREWVVALRKTIVYLWDKKDLPPVVGYNDDEIADAFQRMIAYPVHKFETIDQLTGKKDVIRNNTNFSGYVNSFFPTMMKTKISYSSTGTPRSIYDYFKDDDLLETFTIYANRHFKRDSYYHYSGPISENDILEIGPPPYKVTTAAAFKDWFENNVRGKYPYDYWLCGIKDSVSYSGFTTALGKKKNLYVGANFDAPKRCKTNVDKTRWNKYSIRLYKLEQKVFPIGLKAFKVSFAQSPANFPPLTARYLYEKYTEHIKENDRLVIYDPSCGWGGRLVGAMGVDDRRHIHYVGTDPNTDHNTSLGRTKYHEVAEFFNKNVRETGKIFCKSHTFEIFQKGSEVIGRDPDFQKYKGKVDLIFTSPPYFSKEVYSADKTQSCHKFTTYNDWRDGFLRPTLETCVEYLQTDRYLLWNINDIVLSGKMLPLEKDSTDILKSLGMKYITTIKMALAPAPGGNRLKDTGATEKVITKTVYGEESEDVPIMAGHMKNFCKVKSDEKVLMLKYENIFIFRKP